MSLESSLQDGRSNIEQLKLDLELLWTKYLDQLDKYTRAQQEISKLFASGTFSLAEANFRNNTRTRYGPDYYDARMQAASRFEIVGPGKDITHKTHQHGADAGSDETVSSPQTDNEAAIPASETEEGVQKPKKGMSRDPIRWFGILSPPQLKSCQKNFSSLTQGPVLEAVNAGRALRRMEAEIRQLRKAIRKVEKSSSVVAR